MAEASAATARVEHEFRVDAEGVGARVDRWLTTKLPEMSRSEVQRLIRSGQVHVNGVIPKAAYPLEPDDAVSVAYAPDAQLGSAQPEQIPLHIVYQDDDVLVIDKPSGMVVHPAPGHSGGTLVNAILHHCPDIGKIGGEKRPGIVHRLDKDTSGLILVAKHERALRFLQNQFKARTVRKEYLALVDGMPEPQSQIIQVSLGRHPVDRKRQAAFPAHMHQAGLRVREAITEITRMAVYSVAIKGSAAVGNFSLISALPKTGRTHQIRVHLAWIKHPIVGDPLYGLRPPRLPVPRLFLHAHHLRLRLPSSPEVEVEFCAPLSVDLRAVLDALEAGT